MWTEIPGYQGFKPAEVPFSIVREKIEARKSINKGIMKDNIGDNYHTGMPGYSGPKPKYGKTTGVLRENCFSYK